jgi:uroporphyrinogen decarboxylase
VSNHINVTKNAIEFKGPAYLPLEVIEVPGIYDGYGSLTGASELLQGTENFDSLSVTYSWIWEDMGFSDEGMPLKKDEWGCILKIPPKDYAYLVVHEPLRDWDNVKNYKWPDPSINDSFFAEMNEKLNPYRDRFIAANNDPGPFLLAINIRGFDELLVDIKCDPKNALYVMDGILEYQIEIIKKWKSIGAHALFTFDTWGTQKGLVVNPEVWRKYFKPFYKRYFDAIHAGGMYAGFEGNGDFASILEDLCDIGLDILDLRQCSLYDLDWMSKINNGKLCVKATIDMTDTLPLGKPEDVYREADYLFEKLASRNGGFIAQVAEWIDYNYPHENIIASVEAFNKYRKLAR